MPYYPPASSGAGMAIGGAVTSGTTGSVPFIASGSVLGQDNAHLFWDDTNDRLLLGTATNLATPAKLLLYDAAVPARLAITGLSADASTSAEGVHMFLTHNGAGNRQLMITASDYPIDSSNAGFRMYFIGGAAAMDAISTDGGSPLQLSIGSASGGVRMVGTTEIAATLDKFAKIGSGATQNAKLMVFGDDAAWVGVVVKATAAQSVDLQQWQASDATPLTTIDKDGKLGVFAGFADAVHIPVGSTTGTKIGTATTQKLGFFNKTPVAQPSAYTPTNVTTDRSYDANATTLDELADVVGTLIADFQSLGLVG